MIFDKVISAARRILRNEPGYVDRLDAGRAAGWLAPPAGEPAPARLSLHVDGALEMNLVADLERSDVLAAGKGPLNCGFDVALPKRLRDGSAHTVELRVGEDGPVLRGGRLRIEASADGPLTTAAEDKPALQREGLAFFESAGAVIGGWATGGGSVVMSFDSGPEQKIQLDREVPGFGKGNRYGFRHRIPAEMMDGEWHEVAIWFSQGADMLDGSPVRFRLLPDRPVVEIGTVSGRDLRLCLRRSDGSFSARPVDILADGQALQQHQRAGWINVHLPDGAQHLQVVLRQEAEAVDETADAAQDETGDETGEDGKAGGTVLARYAIGNGLPAEWPVAGRSVDDLAALSDEQAAKATEAFAAFCDAPDARFDALWYAHGHLPGGAADAGAALAHYRDHGARDGLSPGPGFDEATARRIHPGLAAAVADGRLPCLFAIELVRGDGTLGSLTGLTPELRQIGVRAGDVAALADAVPEAARDAAEPAAADPLPTRPAPPVELRNPARSIYAAWLSRLDVTQEQRAEIATDEDAARLDIAGTPLTRKPLVSIIMPSWNRAFTIGEAIQSVLEQSYDNWELLVCDDASEDRTAQVVHGFDDPRIRYMKFLKSNGAGARNKGLRLARGEYIAYLDSDNIWHPLFLEMMLHQLLSRPGRAIAYGAYLDTEITGARVALQAISRPPFRPIRLANKNFIDLNTVLHHRRLYDWFGGFDGSLPRLQDWDLMLRYTGVFPPHYVNRIGVFYRRNVAWGQVTHLFQNSTAQDVVGQKLARRKAGEHERLNIPWPSRPRVTVLSAATAEERLLAENLARMAASVADVDLVFFGAADAGGRGDDPQSLTRIALPGPIAANPARAGYVLASRLAARPVLSVGVPGSTLRALDGLDPALCLRLRGSGEGAELVGLADPGLRYYLGGLPLDLPAAAPDGERSAVLCLQGGDKVAAAGRRYGLDLLVPDQPGNGADWLARMGAVGLVTSLQPVSALDPFRFSLLTTLQGRGVPMAVPVDAGRAYGTSIARQWIEASAAYELKKTDPNWVFDKCAKLLGDDPTIARMTERSRVVHAIAQHPDLVHERLADTLYQMTFGKMTDRETNHDRA